MVLGLFVVACGSAPPSVVPATPTPTPRITPNPHMTDPASADAVFTAIARAKLPITANNAASGSDPVKKINATFFEWPMIISEYRSAASLAEARPWTPGEPPAQGESPVAIAGINILIEWGPKTVPTPGLTPAQVRAMNDFLAILDTYVGPLSVRTTTVLRIPATASAKPSGKPSPKPSAAP